MSEPKMYCQNLYRKRSVKTEEECLKYLLELNTPNLSLEERELCEGKLTLTECWNALQSMKDEKVQETMFSQNSLMLHFSVNLDPQCSKHLTFSSKKVNSIHHKNKQ